MNINISKTRRIAFGFVLAVIAMLSVQAQSWAAFTPSGTPKTLTAQATLVAAGKAAVDVPRLKNFDGTNAAGSNITWDQTGLQTKVANGEAGWTSANVYLVVSSTLTAATGGMQIFTDVIQAGFTGSVSSGGLVNTTDDSSKGYPVLPAAWRVTTGPITTDFNLLTAAISQGVPASFSGTCNTAVFPNPADILWVDTNKLKGISATPLGADVCFPSFLWFMDASDPRFSSAVSGTPPNEVRTPSIKPSDYYPVVKDANYGLHIAEGSPSAAPMSWTRTKGASLSYIYVAADYSNAVVKSAGITYTTKVVLQTYTE